jgi:uncharacterized protein YigE (DUF2233 family)
VKIRATWSCLLLPLAAAIVVGCSRDDAPTAGVKIETIKQDEVSFKIARVDLRLAKVEMFWQRPDGERFGTFAAVRSKLESTGKRWALITNSGIFDPNHKPLGLHIEQSRQLVPLNLNEGAGNFFLKPNGVFLVDSEGAAVVDAAEYLPAGLKPELATQSGPLLLHNGRLHSEFRKDSVNRKIRSGVGIVSQHVIVFVLSENPITFYNFAVLFRDRLDCQDALYLDGEISRFAFPAQAESPEGDFAGFLAVVENR